MITLREIATHNIPSKYNIKTPEIFMSDYKHHQCTVWPTRKSQDGGFFCLGDRGRGLYAQCGQRSRDQPYYYRGGIPVIGDR